MRTAARLIILAVLLIWACPAGAADDAFQIALAEDQVDITTGFDGTTITLFGTTAHRAPNIAVTLSGPETTTVVRRKGRALGMWVNAESVEFRRVPSYYDYAMRLSETAAEEDTAVLADNRIGVDNLAFYAEDADEDEATGAVFRDALIRTMQERGLYPLRKETVDFIGPGFFKVVFNLPPGVPTGTYTVEAMQFDGKGRVVRETRLIRIGQIGSNARIYLLSKENAVLYGMATVMIALLIGWAAFTFLRRD